MVNKSVLVLVLLVGLAASSPDMCYALVMEGGGTHGAYEAGVVYSLAHYLPADQVLWNDISGISTGSLNSGQCAQFAMGDEKAMSEWLVETWTLIKNQNMLAPPWPGSTLHSLLRRPSLFDTSNLRSFLQSRMGTTVLRNVTVGTTNMVNGDFVDFTEALGMDGLLTAVMCSAAPPFAFPPINFQGTWFIDGGVTINEDSFEAVKRCREMGYSLPEITLDMIFDYHDLELPPATIKNAKDSINRVTDIQKYYNLHWYVDEIYSSFPEVNYRYVIFPSQHLPPVGGPPGPPLDFNPVDLLTEIEIGKNDGLNAVSGPTGLKAMNQRKRPTVHYF